MSFDLVALAADASTDVDLSFDALGSQWTDIGIEFGSDAQVQLNATADIELSFGMSLSKAEGIDAYFDLQRFEIAASMNGGGSTRRTPLGQSWARLLRMPWISQRVSRSQSLQEPPHERNESK